MSSAKKRNNEEENEHPEILNNTENKVCLLGLNQSRNSACCQHDLSH